MSVVVRRASGVSSRVVDGRAVIVVMRRESLHSLNPSGTLLWNAIGTVGKTRAQLCEELLSRFRVDSETADADVGRFIEELTRLGAVEEVRRA